MTNNRKSKQGQSSFLSIASSPIVVARAVKVGLVVGTLLALLNHGDKILNLQMSAEVWFKIILTYLVPYSVSTWSAVGAIREKDLSNDL